MNLRIVRRNRLFVCLAFYKGFGLKKMRHRSEY